MSEEVVRLFASYDSYPRVDPDGVIREANGTTRDGSGRKEVILVQSVPFPLGDPDLEEIFYVVVFSKPYPEVFIDSDDGNYVLESEADYLRGDGSEIGAYVEALPYKEFIDRLENIDCWSLYGTYVESIEGEEIIEIVEVRGYDENDNLRDRLALYRANR